MLLRELFEASQSVGLIFGRFNPPHKGHKAAWEMASKNSSWYVGTNKSTQGPKDPLPYDVKIKAMETIWPEVSSHIAASQSWLTLASEIYKKHGDVELKLYTDEEWVIKTINQYNGKEGAHGLYNFSKITPVATPRLSSATELRAAVTNNDPQAFAKAAGVPADTPVDGVPFFDLVAEYLGQYKKESVAAENFLGKIKGALGLGWSKIGDTVRGSMILNYLDGQNFDARQDLKKRIKSSKFKLIEIDLETAKKYRAYTDKKVAFGGSMIDPDREMHSRQWKLTHDSLIKSPPVLMSDGDILDGNHRLDRAIKLELPKIPVLMQVGKSVEENFADGKKPGRKGLAKRSGVNTKASVSSLRKTAKGSSGEKQRMAHWLANMKAGRAKKK